MMRKREDRSPPFTRGKMAGRETAADRNRKGARQYNNGDGGGRPSSRPHRCVVPYTVTHTRLMIMKNIECLGGSLLTRKCHCCMRATRGEHWLESNRESSCRHWWCEKAQVYSHKPSSHTLSQREHGHSSGEQEEHETARAASQAGWRGPCLPRATRPHTRVTKP